ncbi:MAG: hypothetical protein IJ853_02530, partial [Rickettsiales bacterium]|nr:hypothetical protein [Rickettsiales bacterium]
SKTSTTGLTEGTYLKLYSCVSGYLATGNLVYQCVESGESYEWQPVSGYTNGTCALACSNPDTTMITNGSVSWNNNATTYGNSITGTVTCDSDYGTIINTITASCNNGEWSYDTEAKCEVITNNCTANKATKKSGLSHSHLWKKADATGSVTGVFYGAIIGNGNTELNEGTYLRFKACGSPYKPTGKLMYYCEYNSSTNTLEWQTVSGYTDGTCVKDE